MSKLSLVEGTVLPSSWTRPGWMRNERVTAGWSETAEGIWSQLEAADAKLEEQAAAVSPVPLLASISCTHDTQTNYSAPNRFYLFGCSCRSRFAPNLTRWVCLAAVGPDRPPCPWCSGPRPRGDLLHLPPPRWSCWCHWRSLLAHHAGLVTQKKKENRASTLLKTEMNNENNSLWFSEDFSDPLNAITSITWRSVTHLVTWGARWWVQVGQGAVLISVL